jgi:hypothetical protein
VSLLDQSVCSQALDDLKAAQVAHDTVSDDEIPPPPPSLPDPLVRLDVYFPCPLLSAVLSWLGD